MKRQHFLVLAAIMWAACAAPLSATDPSESQSIRIYSDLPTDNPGAAARISADQTYWRDQLLTGAFGRSADFTGKARLAFKTDGRPVAGQTAPLALRIDVDSAHQDGWRSVDQTLLWIGDGAHPSRPLPVALEVAASSQPLRLGEYDEIWLDYEAIRGIDPCMTDVELSLVSPLAGKGSGESRTLVAKTAGAQALKVISIETVAGARLREKDFSYLVQRALGMPPDADWRFTRDGPRTVLQRRMNARLNDIEALDIAVAANARPDQVNLRIGSGKFGDATKLIEIPGLLNAPDLAERRSGPRVSVREILERKFAKEWAENAIDPGRHSFYLQEITVFIPGEPRAIVDGNPVHSIRFLGATDELNDRPNGTQLTSLPTKVVKVGDIRSRFVVDVRALGKKGEFSLHNARLLLRPPPAAQSCAIRLDSARVVATYIEKVPIYAIRVENWSRRWGGTFGATGPSPEQIESPGIIAILPFSAMTQPESPRVETVERASSLDIGMQPGNAVDAPQVISSRYRVVGPDGRDALRQYSQLVTSNGATITAKGRSPRASLEDDLLVLEGRSTALEITWSVSARLSRNTWLYFSVPGGSDQIGSLNLSLGLADGSTVQRRIVANQLQRVINRDAEVSSVKLQILPSKMPYRLKLKDMALFEPKVVSFSQALSIALPTYEVARPKQVLHSAPTPFRMAQPGVLTGLATREALHFTTVLDPGLEWVRSIRLKYRLPPAYGEGDPCPITLKFNWANGTTERTLCLGSPEGDLVVPTANWLGDGPRTTKHGELRSIDWTLLPAAQFESNAVESFMLDFALEGWAMRSATDTLRMTPIAATGGIPVFANPDEISKLVQAPFAPKAWLSLDSTSLSRVVDHGLPIRSPGSELLMLEEIVVEPLTPLSEARWKALTAYPAAATAPRWQKWALVTGVIAVTWFAWRRGLFSLAKNAERRAFQTGLFQRLLGDTRRWAGRWLRRLNLIIGAVALGPGLWKAGQLGWSFPGVMLLSLVSLVTWGVYCHWRDGRTTAAIGAFPGTRTVALGITIGCAVWSLGRYSIGADALWGLLPLIGVIYALLPELTRSLRVNWNRISRFVWLGVWLVAAGLLYRMGLLLNAPKGENYYFTFGGLFAVFAWRAAMLVSEPRLRAMWPAVADRIYAGGGGIYFAGAIVILAATAVALVLKVEQIAHQLGIIVYFCLAIGIALEVWARRNHGVQPVVDPQGDPSKATARQ